MRIRFQADNDLNKAIVRSVVRQETGVDFRSAQAARLDGVPDSDVLKISALEGRILVSHDFHTMPDQFRHFIQAHRSPGVFLIAQDLAIVRAVESLLLIWEASQAEEWANRLCLIPSLATMVISETLS